jgi:hypothetical protein
MACNPKLFPHEFRKAHTFHNKQVVNRSTVLNSLTYG